MALLSSRPNLPTRNPVGFLRNAWRTHSGLTFFGGLTVVLTLFFIIGIFADPRTITGAPAWLKPAKFGVSITLYSFTMVWLLGFIATDRVWKRRLVGAVGWVIVGTFVAEMVPITLQVLRGTTSHFNVATPFDTALWSLMGTAIMILWATNFVVAALLLFQRFENRAFAWSLRFGLVITIIGMGLGFLMTVPTAQQLAGWQAGESVTVAGAHTVGLVGGDTVDGDTVDGGPGLPVVGWSTRGGDLRVGHFVGMHALQVLPFFGLLVARRRKWSAGQKTKLVVTAAAGYLGMVLLVTWQALRAQPLVRPDALTLGVFAALVGGVLVSAWWAARARAHSRWANPHAPKNASPGGRLVTQVFSLSFLLVAPFWGLMMFVPTWGVTKRVVGSPWIAAPAALLYLGLVAPQLGSVLPAVLSPDLPRMTALFSSPAAVTIAWVHFLAFDLFVGRWVYLDGRARGLSPWAVSPLLFLVLMLGPVGFVAYLGLRAWVGLRGVPSTLQTSS